MAFRLWFKGGEYTKKKPFRHGQVGAAIREQNGLHALVVGVAVL